MRHNSREYIRSKAINFIDNGGTSIQFSEKKGMFYEGVLVEEKRRIKVEIRYMMKGDYTFEKQVYRILKVSMKKPLLPEEIYTKLDPFTNKQLMTLVHTRRSI